ncbi:MAG TPA: hypothetical protein VLH58_00545 [Candidatus Methylomirabilis sp.]|nr:hypothetical protein [Candidatus Methylomirabilis sp.]
MSGHLTVETSQPQLHIPDLEEFPRSNRIEPDSWADEGEVVTFERLVRRLRQGELSPDEFKRFRLQHGVYGQRQEGVHMVRVKIPGGGLSARQLDRLAELVAETPAASGTSPRARTCNSTP